MIPKNVFNRYVAASWRCLSCQGECLFSQVSEKHKHRGLSVGVAIFMPRLQSFESGTSPVLFRNQTRYSLSSDKDSPHFMSTRPFKLGNWVEREKKNLRKSPWLTVDRQASARQEREEKWGSCCKNKSSDCVLETCPGTLCLWWDFYLSYKLTAYHFSQTWVTAVNGGWLSKKSLTAELLLDLRGCCVPRCGALARWRHSRMQVLSACLSVRPD